MKALFLIFFSLLMLTLTACSEFVSEITPREHNEVSISTHEKHNVQYPVFGNVENQGEVNRLIIQEVNSIIGEYSLYNDNPENLVTYTIMHNDSTAITVRFDGLVFHADLPYPQRVFRSFSVDLTTSTIIELNQIIEIERFAEHFIASANEQLKAMFPDSRLALSDVFSDGEIEVLLENADVRREVVTVNGETYTTIESLSYITEDYLVIRLSVSHVLGDFWDFFFELSLLTA
jgi:hypothetical protein